MLNPNQHRAAKSCWSTWLVLLIMSVMLVGVGMASPPRTVLIPVTLVGMLVMAWLIVSRFMHLRDEKLGLVVTVIMCTLGLGVTLFLMLVPDGLRIFHLTPR